MRQVLAAVADIPHIAHLRQECQKLKFWHFWVIGIERNFSRCTFNRYSVITQFAKLTAGEQLWCRCAHRKLQPFKTFKNFSWKITDFELWNCCRKWAIPIFYPWRERVTRCVTNRNYAFRSEFPFFPGVAWVLSRPSCEDAERVCKTELGMCVPSSPVPPPLTPSNHTGEECEYYVTPSYHRFTSNRFNQSRNSQIILQKPPQQWRAFHHFTLLLCEIHFTIS